MHRYSDPRIVVVAFVPFAAAGWSAILIGSSLAPRIFFALPFRQVLLITAVAALAAMTLRWPLVAAMESRAHIQVGQLRPKLELQNVEFEQDTTGPTLMVPIDISELNDEQVSEIGNLLHKQEFIVVKLLDAGTEAVFDEQSLYQRHKDVTDLPLAQGFATDGQPEGSKSPTSLAEFRNRKENKQDTELPRFSDKGPGWLENSSGPPIKPIVTRQPATPNTYSQDKPAPTTEVETRKALREANPKKPRGPRWFKRGSR